MNILFTCGGTAGHINPAVALARVFQNHHGDCQILFVGADGGMETRLVPKEGYECRTVTVQHLDHRKSLAALKKNLSVLAGLRTAQKQANAILDEFQPDLVVGTGGYASFPVVKAAAKRGIPTAIHESNAVPGVTTKSLAGVVDLVMVGFEAALPHYGKAKRVEVTGTPVRPDFFRYTRAEARAQLGLTDELPLVLSFWGSLGAEKMNGYMEDFMALAARDRAPFHHIHSGGRDYDAMVEHLQEKGVRLADNPNLDLRQYIYDMPTVMAAADLVLCRAGAATLSELAAIAKPSILVPSPNVTADHQTKNAKVLADQGGAILLPESQCSGEALYRQAIDLLVEHPVRRTEMSRALAGMAKTDAAEHIYETLRGIMRQ